MNYKFYLIALGFLISFKCYSQSVNKIDISEINKRVDKINSEKLAYLEVNYNSSITTEGTQITYGVDSTDTVKKVSVIYYGETGRSEFDYFINKNLMFIVQREVQYSYIHNETTDEFKINRSTEYWTEEKFYFNDKQKLIKWINSEDENITSQNRLEYKSDELISDYKSIVKNAPDYIYF